MSNQQPEASSSSLPSGARHLPRPVLCVVFLFDPRRWAGAVLAIGGVIISAVTPFLPTSMIARMLYAEQTVVATRPRRLSVSGRRKRVRHERHLSDPHFTISPDELLSNSGSSAAASSELASHVNTNEFSNTHTGPPLNIEIIAQQMRCSPPSMSPERMPSIDCLDLASPRSRAASSAASTNSKLQFRVKIGFGKKRMSTDMRDDEYQHVETLTVDPVGNFDPRVLRSNTSPNAPNRKKFSLFHRNRSSYGRSLTSVSDVEYSHPRSSKHTLHPHFPEPISLFHRADQPATSLNEEAQYATSATPPVRPRRTDPYKKYGVPVPGSEEARAFEKAEKEKRDKWRLIQENEAERGRLEREKEKENEEVNKTDQPPKKEKSSVQKAWKRLSKGKEKELPETQIPVSTTRTSVDHPDPGAEADAEDDGHSHQSHEAPLPLPPPKKGNLFTKRLSTESPRPSLLPPSQPSTVSDKEENQKPPDAEVAKDRKKKLRFISGYKKGRGPSTERAYISEAGGIGA